MFKPEILSPAGDFEKMRFAIAYGADAVYMSGKSFGMRAAAGNFNEEDMRKAIEYAHNHGVKCYITANIIPTNEDIKQMPAYFEHLQDVNADAIIVADVGTISMARKYAPKVPLHISTQTSILNYEAANYWAEQGAERIVLARELSLEEIKEIREKTPKELEIEAFVHGAMCISYSGRCLISQYLTGRDANHGACAQPCRWKYNLVEEKRPNEYFPVVEGEGGTYLYNSKDMCMVDHIPELVDAGITSFKIEGRNKTAYYAAGVTSAYRRAVDAYCENPSGFVLPQDIHDEIGKVSHRNYYTGFYFGNKDGQFYENNQYIRDWEVTGMPFKIEGNKATFTLKNRFYAGQELELVQPNKPPYRFTANGIVNEKGETPEVFPHPEMKFTVEFPFEVDEFAILRREKN